MKAKLVSQSGTSFLVSFEVQYEVNIDKDTTEYVIMYSVKNNGYNTQHL